VLNNENRMTEDNKVIKKTKKKEIQTIKQLSLLTFGENKLGIPVVPVRDIVLFPGTIISLFIGRKKSINAVNFALKGDRKIAFVSQYDSNKDEISEGDLPSIVTMGTILQCISLPDETMKLLVDYSFRMQVSKYYFVDLITCDCKEIIDEIIDEPKAQAYLRSLISLYEVYVSLNKKVSPDSIKNISAAGNINLAIDVAASYLTIDEKTKIEISCTIDLENRINKVLKIISSEIEILKAEKSLQDMVRAQMDKNQREYYLHEQMKVIKKELGNDTEDSSTIAEKYKAMMYENKNLSQEARDKITEEIKKLYNSSVMSSESGIVKSYLDLIFALPWGKFNHSKIQINEAIEILSSSHHGMQKAKDTIIEYIAVQQNTKKISGSVLCLHGAPGVGKTTLVRSIAKAMGREYVKISLGGLHDPSELFGHRRTYIGALPGKIIQAMKKAKVSNPVILLDEIDKMSSDYRGDPASVMLEILDPEQNKAFNDHYLEIGYDVSNVVFIATANSLNLPAPLFDRMELIHIPSYLEQEKLEIAKKYIVKRKFEECGIDINNISISDEAVLHIIQKYTREAGVRELERCIGKIARKNVVKILKNDALNIKNPEDFDLSKEDEIVKVVKSKKTKFTHYNINIEKSNIKEYLGIEKFEHSELTDSDMIGVVNGLAYTSAGGDVLLIEGVKLKGKGGLKFTGSLGKVMSESIEACYSYIKANAEKFKITEDFSKFDLHIHAPEGATPKDGPSAGVTICTSIVSMLTNAAVKKNVAMTGEMTLRGKILAIGGLREKLTSAVRSGITDVIIPHSNIKDLEDIPQTIKDKLIIHPCKTLDEVIKIALVENAGIEKFDAKLKIKKSKNIIKLNSKIEKSDKIIEQEPEVLF